MSERVKGPLWNVFVKVNGKTKRVGSVRATEHLYAKERALQLTTIEPAERSTLWVTRV